MNAYIVSKINLQIKDVSKVISYELNEDTAGPVLSAFRFVSAVNAGAGDYVFLKDKYLGIVAGIEADKSTSVVTLRALPISSIFSRKILLGDVETVTEDYIHNTILNNFVSSGDSLLDIPYINIIVKTQTPLGIIPHNEYGIYNLDTFLRYVAKRHGIYTDFELAADSLNVIIEQRTPPVHIIDATVADVISLNETVVSESVSKVTVKTPHLLETYYMFEDGSYGTDPDAGVRVPGRAETVYCEFDDDIQKSAGDIFAKNKYSHSIETEIISASKLYDVKTMRLYDKAKVKTKTGIYDTYISARYQKGTASTVLFKFGDAKLTLTDKLKGGDG